MDEMIASGLREIVQQSRWRDRICLTYDRFYGDLLDNSSLAAMLRFGTPDLVLWRKTHVIWNSNRINAHGDRIIAGLQASLKSPGALLVNEAGHNKRFFYLQQLF